MKVAIIGGGCAGLGAAATLLRAPDVSVHLIEAYDRFGGRAATVHRPAFSVDLGPQFIQDPDINPFAAMDARFGLVTLQPEIDGQYRVQNDGQWENTGDVAGVTANNEAIENAYGVAAALNNAGTNPVLTGADSVKQLALGSNSLGSIGESVQPWQYVAADRERQDHSDHGRNIYVKCGIGRLVQLHAQELLDLFKSRFQASLGRIVTAIDTSGPNVSIATNCMEIIDADYCVVSVPISVVGAIQFIPPLSEGRLAAIDRIRLGSYKKVIFRPTQMPEDIEENVEYYIYDQNGCWQYFRLPTYPDVLIGVTAGDFAAFLDQQTDLAVVNRFVGALVAGGFSLGAVRPRPGELPIVTNWSRQPHILGAYSYTAFTGGEAEDPAPLQARLDIAQPWGRIHFAGEATYIPAYGTLHGAYMSGVNAANAIFMGLGRL